MVLIALFIGALLIVAAVRNSQSALFAALYQDIPGFVVWAAAIFAIGAIGFVPGLKPVSRGLLALVIVAIVVNNYKKIVAGFQDAWQSPPAAMPNAPSSNSGAGNGSAAEGGQNALSLNNLFSSENMSAFAGSSGAASSGAMSSGSFIDAGTSAASVA